MFKRIPCESQSVCLQDVHETAVGALWNLAFNPSNALRMVEEEGVPALVHLCSSSRSKMARFMAALALAYMFDGRYSTCVCICNSICNGIIRVTVSFISESKCLQDSDAKP